VGRGVVVASHVVGVVAQLYSRLSCSLSISVMASELAGSIKDCLVGSMVVITRLLESMAKSVLP